jgi:hypothetical protein
MKTRADRRGHEFGSPGLRRRLCKKQRRGVKQWLKSKNWRRGG